MFALRNPQLLTRGAILIFIIFLQALRISEGFNWTEKEVNRSVAVNQSITLSWKVNYTAQEISKFRQVFFKRYPQDSSSAVVEIGSIAQVKPDSITLYSGLFKPHITVVESASAISEPAITIQDVTKQDETFYRIEVETLGSLVASHTIFLTVFVATHNVATTCEEAVRGQAMTCSCTADGDPVPTIFEWRAPNGTALHNDSSYTTPRVGQSLNGSYYTCVASNGFGSAASRNTSVFNVLFPPKVLSITSSSAYERGSRVELVCSVEGNPPPYIEWINVTDGSVLQNRTVNTSYVIPSVSSNHKGTYRCVTRNRFGNDSRETTITDVFVSTHNVITNCSEAVRGRAMTCNCTADGDPVPTIFEWRAPNGTVLHNGSSYTTPHVEQSLNGSYYTCVASNGFGSEDSRNTSLFNVLFPPKVLSITPNKTYIEGSRVELVCSVEGNPPPCVKWINVTDGSVLQNRTVDTNYVIPSVSPLHKGTYRCVAENRFGYDSNETTIKDVFVGATITNVTGQSRPVCEGEQVVLTCEAEGNPNPYVAWKRNGIVLQNSTNTVYTISRVKRGDEGSYTCEATNVAGSMSNITSIADVQFTAKVLSITPNGNYTKNTNAVLNCSVEGDPPPYVAWINVTDGSVLQNRTIYTSYIIPSVSFHHKGTYRCVTRNRCGNDSKNTTITDVFDPCDDCFLKNKLCDNSRKSETYCKCKEEDNECVTDPAYHTITAVVEVITNTLVKKTENLTNVTLAIENFFKTKYGSTFLWIRIKTATEQASGKTKIVFDAVFKPKAGYTEKEVLEALEKEGPGVLGFSISLAHPCDSKPCPSDRPECTGTSGTEKYSCSDPASNTALFVVIAVVVVILVLTIVAAILWKVFKRKRCRKDRKVYNGEEHKLEERHMSDPSVEAHAGGYTNSGLDQYVDEGPTAVTYAQVNKNQKTGKKPEDLYAKVDMSKKCKKKKPGELMYADLADFQGPAATESAKKGAGQQPQKHKNTDYASITDIMQEREGTFKKVPLDGAPAVPDAPERPEDEKPGEEDAGTKETKETPDGQEEDNSTKAEDGTVNLLAHQGDGDNISNR